jgi:hypothetical protein
VPVYREEPQKVCTSGTHIKAVGKVTTVVLLVTDDSTMADKAKVLGSHFLISASQFEISVAGHTTTALQESTRQIVAVVIKPTNV